MEGIKGYIGLSSSKDNDTQTIEELWISIAKLAAHVVEDNKLYNGSYPLRVREQQLVSIKALVNVIQETHDVVNTEVI